MMTGTILLEQLLSTSASSIKSEIFVKSILQNVGQCLSQFYENMDGAWCDSAELSIENMNRLTDRDEKRIELTKALVDIEQAYFMALRLIEGPIVKRAVKFLRYTLWHRHITIHNDADKLRLRAHVVELAVLQSLLYKQIESKLAEDWASKAKNNFSSYVNLKIDYSLDELEGINQSFVCYRSYTYSALVEYSDVAKGWEEFTEESKEISEAGWLYIQQERNALKQKFENNFSRLVLTPDFRICQLSMMLNNSI